MECKIRKAKDTWNNRQVWPWCTKWSRAKANRVLSRERTGHNIHPLATTQKMTLLMDNTGWSILKSDYLLCSQRWNSSIQSAKTRPGADCGSDHELLIAKFKLQLKNVWKTTRPFRYDLNQILYDYTMEVTNKFKVLDLIDSAWRIMDGGLWHRKGGMIKTSPRKEMQEGKMVVWGENSWEKRSQSQGKRKDISIWMHRSKE